MSKSMLNSSVAHTRESSVTAIRTIPHEREMQVSGSEDPFTDTSPSACLSVRCPATGRCHLTGYACLYGNTDTFQSRTDRRGDPLASLHCIYFVVHMYARADAWNVTLFSSPHHVCFILTPSYFARSRFAVAAADNVLARMAESQLMCNLTCPGDLRIHLYSLCARGHL